MLGDNMLLSLKFLSLFEKKNPVSWKSNVVFSVKCNPMDRGAWRATVHGVAKSRTPLNDIVTSLWWQTSKTD